MPRLSRPDVSKTPSRRPTGHEVRHKLSHQAGIRYGTSGTGAWCYHCSGTHRANEPCPALDGAIIRPETVPLGH